MKNDYKQSGYYKKGSDTFTNVSSLMYIEFFSPKYVKDEDDTAPTTAAEKDTNEPEKDDTKADAENDADAIKPSESQKDVVEQKQPGRYVIHIYNMYTITYTAQA